MAIKNTMCHHTLKSVVCDRHSCFGCSRNNRTLKGAVFVKFLDIKKISQNGQVWIETVLYTLIGLALIGIVLGFVMPKINERKDALLVEQSIEALQVFDAKIGEVMAQSPGSKRIISDFSLKKGDFYIDSGNKKIELTLEGLESAYSEPGVEVPYGKMNIMTNKAQKYYNVTLSVQYDGLDIAYGDNKATRQKFGNAPTPYQFSIEHKVGSDEKSYANIQEILGSG